MVHLLDDMLTLGGSNEVINHLASIDDMSQHVPTMIPMQVLAEIDNARNPMQLTRDRLERAATENQFMNGKIQAIKVRPVAPRCYRDAEFVCSQSYREYYNDALVQSFPDLKEYLLEPDSQDPIHVNGRTNGNGTYS